MHICKYAYSWSVANVVWTMKIAQTRDTVLNLYLKWLIWAVTSTCKFETIIENIESGAQIRYKGGQTTVTCWNSIVSWFHI